jgi:hypothetical protein
MTLSAGLWMSSFRAISDTLDLLVGRLELVRADEAGVLTDLSVTAPSGDKVLGSGLPEAFAHRLGSDVQRAVPRPCLQETVWEAASRPRRLGMRPATWFSRRVRQSAEHLIRCLEASSSTTSASRTSSSMRICFVATGGAPDSGRGERVK